MVMNQTEKKQFWHSEKTSFVLVLVAMLACTVMGGGLQWQNCIVPLAFLLIDF